MRPSQRILVLLGIGAAFVVSELSIFHSLNTSTEKLANGNVIVMQQAFSLLKFASASIELLNISNSDRFHGLNKQAELDAAGNIYVSSDEGKLIRMADAGHCIEVRSALDRQTVGCSVARGAGPEHAMRSLRLEIYLKNGRKRIIESKTPIMEWHFWRDGQQVAVHWSSPDRKGRYALYDSASARLVEEFPEPGDESSLPEWAKGPGQVQDESVLMGGEYNRERTKWIAKVMRQITNIQPGMKRQDLLKFFTTEGGLSTRFQRTYVYSECPYIKVNVRFKAASNEGTGEQEEPDDIIESISPPYLAWRVMD